MPDLSKTTKSITPSRFKSIFENCPEFMPPDNGDVNCVPFSVKLSEVSLFNINCENDKIEENTNSKIKVCFSLI